MNASAPGLMDVHGRCLRDLRVSVTEQCNFRCLYCLPETDAATRFYQARFSGSVSSAPRPAAAHPAKAGVLGFEEIERAVRVAAGLGIEKIRLTGGEPLLRRNLETLVERIARIPVIRDLAMTTNGSLFPEKARALRDAGLRRVSFSLDSLDRENFRKITGRDGLVKVLESIELAQELGLNPVKVNAVIIRDLNGHELEALAGFAREKGVAMRFIEFMPLDSGRLWKKELVVPGREMLRRLQERFELRPIQSDRPSETARRWSFADGPGEVGVIAPVTEPFCGHCDRLRLTADGKVRTCLFSAVEHDLGALLRGGAPEEDVVEFLRKVAWQKEARHHIGEPEFVQPERTMSCIGG